MAVNSYLIAEKLKGCFFKKLDKCTTECKIRYVTIYNPQIKMCGNTAYIVVDTHIFVQDNASEKCLLIVLGNPDEAMLENTVHDVLCVEKAVGLGGLYENLQEIMEYYNSWEDELSRMLLNGTSLSRMCSVSVPYFRNPLTVQNESFELIGVGETEDIRYPYNFREGESDYLSEEWVESALNAPFDIFSRKGPFVFNYIKAHESLLMNIFINNAFVAQICVDANHNNFVIEDFIRVSILAGYVKLYLKYNSSSLSSDKSRFSLQIKNYVNGRDNLSELKLTARIKKWKMDDSYVCCVMEKTDERIKNISYEYFCKKCLDRIEDSVAFPYGENVYMLVRLGENSQRIQTLQQQLDNFAGEYGFFAGVSFVFEQFGECRDFFEQAKAIVQLRENTRSAQRVCFFEKCKLDYVIRYGMDSLPLYTFITPGLKELMNYDEENNAEMLITLKTYLKNSLNMTETANELFVHRSTLKYRLEKIRQILGVEFEEYHEQMYLQMLLYELEEKA